MMNNEDFKILVIDDTEDINFLIVKSLERVGFKPVSAQTYNEAKELLKANEYDLVTLDWELDGKNVGLDLLLFIPKKTKVLLLSGMPIYQLSSAERLNDKIDDYLSKPQLMDQLLFKVKRVLGVGGGGGGGFGELFVGCSTYFSSE